MSYLRTVTVSAFFARLGFGTIAFLIPYSFGVEGAVIAGVVIALRPAMEMFLSIPAGILSDHIGRKVPLFVGLTVTGGIVCTMGMLQGPIQFGIATAALGCSSALVITASFALAMDQNPLHARGRVLGVTVAALSAGSFVGFLAGGVLLSKFSHEIIYLTLGMLTIVAGVTTLFHFPSSQNYPRKLGSRFRVVSPIRSQVWLLVNILVVLVLVSTATIFLPVYARKIQLPPALASTSYLLLASLALASYIVGGRSSDRWGRRNVMYIGLFLLLFSEISLAWGYGTGNWSIVFPFLALASIGVGAYAPSAIALLGDSSPKGAYGASMGVYDFLLSLSDIIGPLIAGVLVGLYGFTTLALFGVILIIFDLTVLRFKPFAKVSR